MASVALGASMKKFAGFSLTEMVIVVAIITILGAIAWPSYMRSVMKANRTDARTELMDYAQRVQRCFTATGKYDGTCSAMTSLAGGVTSRGGFYTLTAVDVSTAAYTLQAVPVADKVQSDDKPCVLFELDETGRKTAEDNRGRDSSDTCW